MDHPKEKKRAKKTHHHHANNATIGVPEDLLKIIRGPKPRRHIMIRESVPASFLNMKGISEEILELIVSFVGSFREFEGLLALRATSRTLQKLADQQLERSVLKEPSLNDFMFSEAYGTHLRVPEFGRTWSNDYASREGVVASALRHELFGAPDYVKEQAKRQLPTMEQVHYVAKKQKGLQRYCTCSLCHYSMGGGSSCEWTIRATCDNVSAQRARQVIYEIDNFCTHKSQREFQYQFCVNHLEKRADPDRYVTGQAPNFLRRHASNTFRHKALVLLAVADKSSFTHACISVKGKKQGKKGTDTLFIVRTVDVIQFRTKHSNQEVAFLYHDEHRGREYTQKDFAVAHQQEEQDHYYYGSDFFGDY